MKQITILGGSGFLGSHLADELTRRNYKVKILDIKKSKYLKKSQSMVIGNINNIKDLTNSIKGSSYVFNFAALADLELARTMPILTSKINIEGTINALMVCKKLKVKKFIQASSIYANSIEGGFYSVSKRSAEDYIVEFNKVYNLNFTILRFGSLYGLRADQNNGIRKLINFGIKKRRIVYRGGKNAKRNYIHIEDASSLCCEAIKAKYNNKFLNIIGKKSTKIIDLTKFLANKLNIKKNKIKFLNEKQTGHYDIKPTRILRQDGTNIYMKKEKNFHENILNLISNYINKKNS